MPLVSLLLFGFALHVPTAYSAPGDPPVGSPAGSVYVLPLEQGRADAAPKGDGGTTPGGGAAAGSADSSGQGETGSLYRSENNFGSSSRVPGLAAAGLGGGNGSSGSGGGATSGTPGSGVGGTIGGGAIAGGGTVAAEVSDVGNTSPAASIALLVGIAGVATAVGVLSRRFSRRRT